VVNEPVPDDLLMSAPRRFAKSKAGPDGGQASSDDERFRKELVTLTPARLCAHAVGNATVADDLAQDAMWGGTRAPATRWAPTLPGP
jgi:DNA-directed RNA polymerase specialized sigma24 family protein